jgi:transglutaminase-like putative cysteine protease
VTLNGRMTITAAVAVVLSSTVLYPVFTDSLWFAASIGAVATAALAGALTRLRTLPVAVCLAGGVVALLLYLNLVFEARHSLLAVIPTAASISRLWQLAGTGMHDANRYAPPVPNLPGLLLLSTAGVGITAVLTDLIAVRLRSTALAGLPLLVLFTVPVMIDAPHSQLTTGVVFCLGGAGYLAMLSADGRERIRVWGRLISLWRPSSRAGSRAAAYNGTVDEDADGAAGRRVRGAGPGPDTRALAAAGRRVGLASIVVALCAPLLIPGLHPSKLLSSGPGIGGTGGGTGALSLSGALAQAVAQLRENHPSVVFTYTTDASKTLEDNNAQYFRQYVFDTLDDTQGWEVTNYAQNSMQITTMPTPQGLTDTSSAQLVETTITTTKNFPAAGAQQPAFLPLIYPAMQVYAEGKWLTDPDLMVYSTDSSIVGQSYTEASLDVDPTTTKLEELGKPAKTASLSPDLQLPSSYQSPALKKLAETYVAGQSTEIGEVNALANWLSGAQFSYSLTASLFNSANGLMNFLTKTKNGFCVQYAYAMTVLTRLLGIPARFVVGYTSGTPIGGNKYEVKNTDAHAWTEVYFPTFGWIRFEPTPSGGQGTAHAPNYMGTGTGIGSLNSTYPTLPVTKTPGSQTSGQRPNQFGRQRTQPGSTGAITTLSDRRSGTPWAAIALAVIAAIALACGVIAMVAPPAQRALSAHASAAYRPRPFTAILLVAAAAGLVALALYRLLSRTSSVNLGAGWATVGIAFGAAAAVALIAPGTSRIALRRWRWMHATDDVSRAHAAWREFHDDLTDYGVTSRPSEPPRTLAARVTAGLPEPAREAVAHLALAEERASYAATPAQSQNLRHDSAAARHGLAAAARRSTRWRARLFPASLITALADTATQIPDRATARLTRRRTAHRPAN